MKSAAPGSGTSRVEVTGLSGDGFTVLLDDEQLFVSFAEFPWFRDASAAEIGHVERPTPDHLHWPSLDIDLAVESIRHPERFPLVSRA